LYERLFLSEQPGGEDTSKELNPESLTTVRAKLEPSLRNAKAGDRFQFERQAFFYVDPVDSREGAPGFNRTVGLKDSWAKVVKAAAPGATAEAKPAKAQAQPAAKEPAKKERAELSAEAKALAAAHGLSADEAALIADEVALRVLFTETVAA